MTKKKKVLITVISIFAAILIFIAGAFAVIIHKGYGLTVARALITDNNTYMMVDESSPTVMSTTKDKDEFFKNIKTGDKIFVLHSGIEESYPAQTGAYLCIKFEDGSVNDINSEVILQLAELGWLGDDFGGVTIDKMQITLPEENAVADMLAFFIYNGKSYIAYEELPDDSLKGKYIGKATGSIDEWTSSEDYIDFSGSISGEIYSLKGYDSDFMLCIDNGNGSITTYINNNGINLTYGYELFRNRLNLKDNYTAVKYQTRDDWYYNFDDPVEFNNKEAINAFIDALNDSRFMYSADIPVENENSSIYEEKEIYHIFFEMKDSTYVHLRLFDGGYVMFAGISDICVKMTDSDFNNLIKLFTEA